MEKQKDGYSIMMLDDDNFLLGMYLNKFNKAGHQAEGFTKGESLLERLREKSEPDPDIVILDVVMPDMDGVQVLENIKKESLASEAVTIMLTNQDTDKTDIKKVKDLGVDGYIVKSTLVPSEVVDTVLKIAEDSREQ